MLLHRVRGNLRVTLPEGGDQLDVVLLASRVLLRIRVQAATAATYYAAMALNDETPDAMRAVSVAKSFASDAITTVAGDALQTHGGIGFTWEHDLHLYIRRVNANALLYGDITHHRELLCRWLEEHGAGAQTATSQSAS